MILFAQRLNREETDADKAEFVRGAVGLSNNGSKKVLKGIVAGYLIGQAVKRVKKNG